MIIEVTIEGEDSPRLYELRRHGDRFSVRRTGSVISAADGSGAPGGVGSEAPAADGAGGSSPTHIDWRRPEEGVYSLLIDGRSYEVFVDEIEEEPGILEVHLLNRILRMEAVDARQRRAAARVQGTDGLVRITAPIPGRVVKVLRSAGSAVQRGEGIIVLEAMKMENELKAPRDGTVTTIDVEEGQGVEGGALLATIE